MDVIRIVVVGDEQVGKTSIISTFLSESFSTKVQKTLQRVVIPPDLCLEGGKYTPYLHDTSCSEMERTTEEIQRAHCVLLVYDVNKQETITRLQTYWLARIQKLNGRAPILLVGNKVDQRLEQEEGDQLTTIVNNLVSEFEQVEIGLECSAMKYLNIIDVICAAQRAVLFPILPLFDPFTKGMKSDYVKALKRIFRIADLDKDGIFSDDELSNFHTTVFNEDLKPREIATIKELLLDECNSYTPEIAKKGLNFESFKTFLKILILKQKQKGCWTMLRFYNYNDELKIKESYFTDQLDLDSIRVGDRFELSEKGQEYVEGVFKQYSREEYLDRAGIEEIFSSVPKGVPFNLVRSVGFSDNKLSLTSWTALWQMLFALDYKNAYRNIVYIGYTGTFKSFIVIIRPKLKDLLGNIKNRKVFTCLIFGSPKSGKTSVLESAIGNHFQMNMAETRTERSVVLVSRDPKTNTRKYIIIREFPEEEVEKVIMESEELALSDCMLLAYENKESSIKYIRDILNKLPSFIPRIAVNTKSDDLPQASSTLIRQSDNSYGADLNIRQNIKVSAKEGNIEKLLDTLLNVLLKPSKGMTNETIEEMKKNIKRYEWLNMKTMSIFAGIVGTLALAGYGLFKCRKLIKI